MHVSFHGLNNHDQTLDVGRTTERLWTMSSPMRVRLHQGEHRRVVLRRDDIILLYSSVRQAAKLRIPPFLVEDHRSSTGTRVTLRLHPLTDCEFFTAVLWEPDDPEFVAYRAELQQYHKYRDSIIEASGD